MSYQGLGEESYTAFKQRFYARTGDGSMFDCDGINLLKVVLDGLKVNYVQRGRYRNQLLLAAFIDRLYRILKRPRTAPPAVPQGKVLTGLSSRSVSDEQGKPVPVFFERIFRELGRSHFLYVAEGPGEKAKALGADFGYETLAAHYAQQPLSADMRRRRKALRAWFGKLKQQDVFDAEELENIGYALDKFFRENCVWQQVLEQARPLRVIVSSHYHHEGLIAAAKARGTEVVELQHGLISPEDIFHLFPAQVAPVMPRALLPDRMLVFGAFWTERKRTGAEACCMTFETGGYFLYQNTQPGPLKAQVEAFVAGRKVVLVTSQYSMHSHFLEFAKQLSAKLSQEWCILLKPHPFEPEELFAELNSANALVTTANLDFLFTLTSIQVSVFSTTLFDGLRYGVINYSLDIPQFSDYVQSMVESGIAQRLDPQGDPTAGFEAQKAARNFSDPERYYKPFDKALFEKLLRP